MKKSKIIIEQLENGRFDVHHDGKRTGELGFDEMLGTVAQLAMPENKKCLEWFKFNSNEEK